jgi:hypothetical protein
VRFLTAVGIDVVMVLVFAVVGRRSHSEADTVLGVLETAWPYLVATVAGSLLCRGWRRPYAWSTAVVVWVTTVVLGMILRLVAGGGAAWPFWIVAFISLGILLLGWRLLARAILRARSRTRVSSRLHP